MIFRGRWSGWGGVRRRLRRWRGSWRAVGVDAVLDLGFTTAGAADGVVGERLGLRGWGACCMCWRWMRRCGGRGCVERNRGESGTYAFEVTREMFDFMEERWEAPWVEERAEFAGGRGLLGSSFGKNGRASRDKQVPPLGLRSGRNDSQQGRAKASAKAIGWSLRPLGFTPAFGRAVFLFVGAYETRG